MSADVEARDRAALAKLITDMVEVADRIHAFYGGTFENSYDRAQLIAIGYPDYLPDFGEFAHDLVLWRDAVRAAPSQRGAAIEAWTKRLSDGRNLAELNAIHDLDFATAEAAAIWVVEKYGEEHMP